MVEWRGLNTLRMHFRGFVVMKNGPKRRMIPKEDIAFFPALKITL